jgi:hypothetical protein
MKRIHGAGIRLYRSGDFEIGTNWQTLDQVSMRTIDDAMDRAVPLYTGDKDVVLPSDWDREGRICWRSTEPLPLTVLMIVPRAKVSDDY